MGLEDLAPTAMLKIEALALEGLKVQAEMAEQDAPYAVEPMADESSSRRGTGTVALLNPGRKQNFMSMDEWMHDQEDEEQQTVAKQTSWKGGGARRGFMDSTVTLAMLVHLRDPLRNNEPVGAPMMALVQAERVLRKPAARRRRSSISSSSSEPEKSSDEDSPPQFKIVDITIAGLRTSTTTTEATSSSPPSTIWGSQKQLAAGSRWLAAHGMAKATSRSSSFKTNKPVAVSSKSALWSMSDRVYGSGARWQGAAPPLHPHIRNPDVLFADTGIRTC